MQRNEADRDPQLEMKKGRFLELIERGGNPEIIPEMGRSGFWRISLFERWSVDVNLKADKIIFLKKGNKMRRLRGQHEDEEGERSGEAKKRRRSEEGRKEGRKKKKSPMAGDGEYLLFSFFF